MRCLLSTVALLSVSVAVGCHHPTSTAGYAKFGAPIQTSDAVALAKAVNKVDAYAGKPVLVKAEIDEVCAKMGCWMLLKDGDHRVRVRFTASEKCTDGFFVPRNAAAHDAYVHGTLQREEISEELARHYAEDTGKSPAEIEAIVGPQKAVTLLATGVMISDAKTLDPPVK